MSIADSQSDHVVDPPRSPSPKRRPTPPPLPEDRHADESPTSTPPPAGPPKTTPPGPKAQPAQRSATADEEPAQAEQKPESEERDQAQEQEEQEQKQRAGGFLPRLDGTLGFFTSAAVHLAILVLLAVCAFALPRREVRETLVINPTPQDEELESMPLVQEIAAAEQASRSLHSFSGLSGELAASGALEGDAPELDKKAMEAAAEREEVELEDPLAGAPSVKRMLEPTPDGALGDPRAIVDNYDQAMERITQDTLWMLAQSNVLLIWCFDQSESMKDDQEEIRQRVKKVYSDLGLRNSTASDALTSAVTSFGKNFIVHTKKPSSDLDLIERAIHSVPIDPSGKEMMCPAVASSIGAFQEYAKRGKRQIALVLVTDESGDRPTNVQMLENTIALAKAAKCRIYVLGREAVFGYPYAHMVWRHPFTGAIHHLPIDRGPETGYVEQLQTECFRKRKDAHPSGFGSYEQTRMVRETGGVFFMLPSLETNLYRGEKRRYALEQMRPYRVDLRARPLLAIDRQRSVLRTVLTKIIHDLDPYRPEVAEVMELSFVFPARPDRFLTRARQEQIKAKAYLQYLLAALKALDQIRYHRDQETSPRWQANYDLIYAQLLAYIARTYEYGAYLEAFIANPKPVPLQKPKFLRLARWHLRDSKNIVGGQLTATYIQRGRDAFEAVIADHPGTPWAARAQWELDRGFGVELFPDYDYYGPRAPSPPSRTVPKIPIPKL